ncbi:hypothetical protein F511_35796 [Dorcoceras hygrometricum]|uniref:Uncharacterized protein n=1 Tax=Dorcoceras hygrometricum TaxID=472368 RepID=A0A2Z7CS93_9LAMI|nr:hypothetical protein F511_35796 [Dorcoceras hygrometricum]
MTSPETRRSGGRPAAATRRLRAAAAARTPHQMRRWSCAFAQRRVQHEAWPRNECAASSQRASAACHPASNDRTTSGRGVARPARITSPIQRAAAAVLHRETTPIIGATKRPPRTISAQPDCGRYRQSGPRPEPRLLCQHALEALTNSARTDSPRRIGRNEFRQLEAAAAVAALGGGGGGL